MDEGKHYEADTFDFHNYVAIFLYSGYCSLVSGKGTACDADLLAFFEILFCEDFAAGGVFGCEEA